MSRTFSAKKGSVESLKVSARCGCRPKARQTRPTVVTDKPVARAMVRRLQWLAFSGRVESVRSTSSATCSSPIRRGAPGRLEAPPPTVEQPVRAQPGEALAPLTDGVLGGSEFGGNRRVAQAIGRPQHDPRPQGK